MLIINIIINITWLLRHNLTSFHAGWCKFQSSGAIASFASNEGSSNIGYASEENFAGCVFTSKAPAVDALPGGAMSLTDARQDWGRRVACFRVGIFLH